jgi:hypothetical protein
LVGIDVHTQSTVCLPAAIGIDLEAWVRKRDTRVVCRSPLKAKRGQGWPVVACRADVVYNPESILEFEIERVRTATAFNI